jgi:MoaA/NifB/PqqE/SkfB family radical SAM enzyme
MIRARHFRMASRFLAHRFRELHPYEVQALLLNACNLKCSYCRCPEIKKLLLTTEQWRDIIRGLARLGTLRIKFQGGEPTLRADFAELCAEAKRAGLLTAVVTNGLRVAEQPALLADLDEVVVSLDAVTPAIHDRLRGQGTHSQVIRAIDLARTGGRKTYVVMVVTQQNLSEIEPMLRFCEERGVRLHAQPVMFGLHYSDEHGRSLALTAEQARAMHVKLSQWCRQGRGLMFSAPAYEKMRGWPDYDRLTTPSDGPSKCMAGKFYVHIEADGDVWPCQQHGAPFVAKNIVRDGLEAALRNAQRHTCGDCFTVYLNERKSLFGFKPAALLGMIGRG